MEEAHLTDWRMLLGWKHYFSSSPQTGFRFVFINLLGLIVTFFFPSLHMPLPPCGRRKLQLLPLILLLSEPLSIPQLDGGITRPLHAIPPVVL